MKKIGTYWAVKELVDFDYFNKLSPEESAWLKKFRDEYYYDKLTAPPPIHKRKKQQKELHSLNNERRRDIWNAGNRVEGDPDTILHGKEKDEPEAE